MRSANGLWCSGQGSVRSQGADSIGETAPTRYLRYAATISEISERQRVRKSRRCAVSGTWGSPRPRTLKYCYSSSKAEQNRDADSKFPKPRIG